MMKRLKAVFSGAADRVVPPSGETAWLTVASAAILSFLSAVALALALAAGALGAKWADELGQAATVRITADGETADAELRAALDALRTTPGILKAEPISQAEQADLLAPWLGADFPEDLLPRQRLIEVTENPERLDRQALALRLEGEAPSAIYDSHGNWRQPLLGTALSLRMVAGAAVILCLTVLGATISLAATASLAASREVIETLHLIGARDAFIVRAFVRRFTIRTLAGACLGAAIAAILLWLMPVPRGFGSVSLRPAGVTWLPILFLPAIAAGIAYLATRTAARRLLERLR